MSKRDQLPATAKLTGVFFSSITGFVRQKTNVSGWDDNSCQGRVGLHFSPCKSSHRRQKVSFLTGFLNKEYINTFITKQDFGMKYFVCLHVKIC